MSESGTYDYEREDPHFLADLRASRKAVERVAHWLSARGYSVVLRPMFERPDVSRMADYADTGDLGILQRVEVKQRKTLTFSSKADFPYPSLIVDACHCYDNAHPKPYAYVILNREMDAGFVVDCRTARHWTRLKKYDRFKNRERSFYECPLELVSVIALEQE